MRKRGGGEGGAAGGGKKNPREARARGEKQEIFPATHPVLVGEPVDAEALALAALGVGPVLVLHLAGDAHQVGLDDVVLFLFCFGGEGARQGEERRGRGRNEREKEIRG